MRSHVLCRRVCHDSHHVVWRGGLSATRMQKFSCQNKSNVNSQVALEIAELEEELEVEEKTKEVEELTLARDDVAANTSALKGSLSRARILQEDLGLGRKKLGELQDVQLPEKVKEVAEVARTVDDCATRSSSLKIPVQILNLTADVLWETDDLLGIIRKCFSDDIEQTPGVMRWRRERDCVRSFLVNAMGCNPTLQPGLGLRAVVPDFISLVSLNSDRLMSGCMSMCAFCQAMKEEWEEVAGSRSTSDPDVELAPSIELTLIIHASPQIEFMTGDPTEYVEMENAVFDLTVSPFVLKLRHWRHLFEGRLIATVKRRGVLVWELGSINHVEGRVLNFSLGFPHEGSFF